VIGTGLLPGDRPRFARCAGRGFPRRPRGPVRREEGMMWGKSSNTAIPTIRRTEQGRSLGIKAPATLTSSGGKCGCRASAPPRRRKGCQDRHRPQVVHDGSVSLRRVTRVQDSDSTNLRRDAHPTTDRSLVGQKPIPVAPQHFSMRRCQDPTQGVCSWGTRIVFGEEDAIQSGAGSLHRQHDDTTAFVEAPHAPSASKGPQGPPAACAEDWQVHNASPISRWYSIY